MRAAGDPRTVRAGKAICRDSMQERQGMESVIWSTSPVALSWSVSLGRLACPDNELKNCRRECSGSRTRPSRHPVILAGQGRSEQVDLVQVRPGVS